MDERMKRLLGEGPYPFSEDDIESRSSVESFMGQGMIILTAKKGLDMPVGNHTHLSYEFLIPYSDMPNTSVGKKFTYFEKNRLFAINSEQPHGPTKEIMNCRLLGFQIDKELLNEVAQAFCGTRDVVFENENTSVGNEIPVLIRMFMEETENSQSGCEFIQQNIINLITTNLLRQVKSNIPKLISEKIYCESENINRAISYLREEYSNDFCLKDVANIANLSQYHFIRTFKSVTGKTPYDYLLDVKIEKSKDLLKLKKYSITDICFMCGFNNLGHFSSVFKRKVGILPSQYRKL